MATGALAPSFYFTALDDNGDPYNGAHLYFYLSGTLTPVAVYHDAALSTPWAFPATTDSAGRIVVYLDPTLGNLKLILTDPNDVPFGPTVDPVAPTNTGTSGMSDVFVFCANSAALITNTTITSGATVDKLQPGSSVWGVDPDTLAGTYQLEITGVQNTAGTLSVSVVNLSDGSPDVPLATASLTSTTGARAVSGPITFPSGGSTKLLGIKALVSANSGFVIGARITRSL